MKQIALINGPNLNLLGRRETEHYGTTTLATVEKALQQQAQALGVHLSCFQSNHEGTIIDHIQHLQGAADALIINPGAYTHTSIAIRDALLATQIPFIEVHLSNIYQREHFRQRSYFSDIAKGVIIGMGPQGYHLALNYLAEEV